MRKCINCEKGFDDRFTNVCSWCGAKNPDEEPTEKARTKEQSINKIESSNHPSENTLNSVANFILAVGIISFVVLMFTVVFVESPGAYYSSSTEFNPAGFGTAVATLLTSIATYSIMKVIRLISINTRKTKEYLEGLYKRQQDK